MMVPTVPPWVDALIVVLVVAACLWVISKSEPPFKF